MLFSHSGDEFREIDMNGPERIVIHIKQSVLTPVSRNIMRPDSLFASPIIENQYRAAVCHRASPFQEQKTNAQHEVFCKIQHERNQVCPKLAKANHHAKTLSDALDHLIKACLDALEIEYVICSDSTAAVIRNIAQKPIASMLKFIGMLLVYQFIHLFLFLYQCHYNISK